MSPCNICLKRVLPHCYQLKCCVCTELVHLKCLPYLDASDSIYTDRFDNRWICPSCSNEIFPFNHIDCNEDFVSALAEMWHNAPALSFQTLLNDNRVFQPFEINSESSSPLFDIDPDIQFYQNQQNTSLQSCD